MNRNRFRGALYRAAGGGYRPFFGATVAGEDDLSDRYAEVGFFCTRGRGVRVPEGQPKLGRYFFAIFSLFFPGNSGQRCYDYLNGNVHL